MPDTFQNLKSALESIDDVLNSELYHHLNSQDLEKGFNPDAENPFENIRRIQCNGINALKARIINPDLNASASAKALLIEIKLQHGSEIFERLYIRGFEWSRSRYHYELAEQLIRELNEITRSDDFCSKWPRINDIVSKEARFTKGQCMVTVRPLGGGNYRFFGQDLLAYSQEYGERSAHFGGVSDENMPVFKQMLNDLVKKPEYEGFSVRITE